MEKMQFDEYLISIHNEQTRENLKQFFEQLVADGRPLKAVYIEGNCICIIPEGSER